MPSRQSPDRLDTFAPREGSSFKLLPRTEIAFPAAWTWLFDESIPQHVKDRYSPQESWKGKPFEKQDARFFFKGIEELSELFTNERPKSLPEYFSHPRFRSGYLLYFLPMQASKFITLFRLYPKAMQAALDHAKKEGVLRVLDLGAGPGTASIALLLWLLDEAVREGTEVPRVELEWFDVNKDIMREGKELAEMLASNFPRLRGKLEVRIHATEWWNAPAEIKKPASLVLLGNVLNEASFSGKLDPMESWRRIFAIASGGGILAVEPANKGSSQLLSRLRDSWLEAGLIEPEPSSIWGPCLHAQACPMADGRDWCHFSYPVQMPGNWFREFSKGLGSERQWAKFSYIWASAPGYRAPVPESSMRRVISDSIESGSRGSERAHALLCEPGQPGNLQLKPRERVFRGDVIKLPRGAGRD